MKHSQNSVIVLPTFTRTKDLGQEDLHLNNVVKIAFLIKGVRATTLMKFLSSYVEPDVHLPVDIPSVVEIPESHRGRHKLEQERVSNLPKMVNRRLHLHNQLKDLLRVTGFFKKMHCEFAYFWGRIV